MGKGGKTRTILILVLDSSSELRITFSQQLLKYQCNMIIVIKLDDFFSELIRH